MTNRPQSLADVLNVIIDQMGLRPRMNAAMVVETWAEIAGPQINGVTSKVWYQDGTLYIKLRSAPWRHALHMRRRDWLNRLNKELAGRTAVQEVVFR
ncbi:MAG: DUF721 domain-containing protein [Bacteroidota bacterium]